MRLRDENDIRGLYQGIKEIIGPTKRSLNLVKSKEGEVLKEKTDQLRRWKEHFYEVLNQENPVETIIPEFDNILGELICDDPPSTIEISRAINALKNHKSAGEDKIVAEMIKVGGDKSIQMLQSLLNKIWREKVVPQDWRDSMVVPIHKKGDKANCSNYRGISLLSVPGKVLSRILYGRLLPMADAYLREGQCGFRRERSTVDMIFSTRQLVEKKALHINHNTWRELATDRNTWRTKVKSICTELHQEKIKTAVTLRTEKKRSEENLEWQCPLCSFKRQGVRARQYVLSHISQKHPREPSPETTQDPLTCRICNLKCKSKSGLSCHMRIIHQDRGDTSRRPIKTMNTHDPGLATTSTPQNEPPQSPNMQSQSSQLNLSPPDDRSCPVCRRTCKSRAGLKIHMRNNQQCRQLLERSIIGNDAGS